MVIVFHPCSQKMIHYKIKMNNLSSFSRPRLCHFWSGIRHSAFRPCNKQFFLMAFTAGNTQLWLLLLCSSVS